VQLIRGTRTASGTAGQAKRWAFVRHLVFNDFCQTNYLKIYWTDLRQMLRDGRTMAVGDQSELSFSILQGTLPWQPIFVVVHGCRGSHLAQLGEIKLGLALDLHCNVIID